jgi:hypothetical protein
LSALSEMPIGCFRSYRWIFFFFWPVDQQVHYPQSPCSWHPYQLNRYVQPVPLGIGSSPRLI